MLFGNMGKNLDVSSKIAFGYVSVIALFVAAIFFVWISIRSLSGQEHRQSTLNQRAEATHKLLSYALNAEEAAQVAVIGGKKSLTDYNERYSQFISSIDSLRQVSSDSSVCASLDSIAALSDRKHAIVEQIALMGNDYRDFDNFDRTVNDILAATDTLSGKTITRTIREERHITVNANEGNFFKRLGRVFSSGKRDTTDINRNVVSLASDTTSTTSVNKGLSQKYNAASMLMTNRLKARSKAQQNNLAKLQRTNIELGARITGLLIKVQEDEAIIAAEELKAIDDKRTRLVAIIGTIAFIAIILAAIFYVLTRRDVIRAARDKRVIEESNERITALMDERESMMLTITHDLKSPAASVIGYARELSATALNKFQRECIDNITNGGNRVLDLASSILDYHRIEAGKANVVLNCVRPSDIIISLAQIFRPLASAKGLDFKVSSSPSCSGYFRLDTSRFRTIADNLISNAIKYTSEGSISITADINDSILKLTVGDTGCGISPLEQGRIFNKFARTSETESIEGAGLGLSIVSSMASLIGARVEFESTLGEGSRFTILLPVEMCEESDIQHSAHADGEPCPEFNVSPELLVLVVDDDSLQRKLVISALRRAGVRTTPLEAASADSAIERINQTIPDVIITDLQMPHVSGIELCDRVRQSYPDIPIIALTAADPGRSGSDISGFMAMLSKPVEENELSRLISTIVPRWRTPDLYPFIAFAEGNADDEFDILTTLRDECTGYIDALENALSSYDTEIAAATIHKVMPVLKMAGAPVNGEYDNIERELRDGRTEQFLKLPAIISMLRMIILAVDKTIGEDD